MFLEQFILLEVAVVGVALLAVMVVVLKEVKTWLELLILAVAVEVIMDN
jgi:hypothetical protein